MVTIELRSNMKRIVLFVLAMVFTPLLFAEVAWIDVRSPEEYSDDHIDGDINIPHELIVTEVEKLYPDKSTDIHLYCRSGRRAGIAMSKLREAGYSNVTNEGGIGDAREKRAGDK